MADSWEAPNHLDVVQRVNAERPGLILNPHAFTTAVVCELRKIDPKWGRNGKRGDPNNLSDDASAWKNPNVPWGCSIVDMIGNSGLPSASPAWIDQTRRTAEGGTVGLWVDVDCSGAGGSGGGGGGTTPPVVVVPTPPAPGYDDTAIKASIAALHGKVDDVLSKLDAAASQQAADTDQIGKWMVEQAQGVVNAVNGTLAPKIDGIKCNFRSPFRGGADVAGLPGDAED